LIGLQYAYYNSTTLEPEDLCRRTSNVSPGKIQEVAARMLLESSNIRFFIYARRENHEVFSFVDERRPPYPWFSMEWRIVSWLAFPMVQQKYLFNFQQQSSGLMRQPQVYWPLKRCSHFWRTSLVNSSFLAKL